MFRIILILSFLSLSIASQILLLYPDADLSNSSKLNASDVKAIHFLLEEGLNQYSDSKIISPSDKSLCYSKECALALADEYNASQVVTSKIRVLGTKIIFTGMILDSNGENEFFYYEDKFGGLKLPKPNVLGQFQQENISTAIATLRILDLGIEDHHIKKGIQKIDNIARLQKIESGKLKNLVKDNLFLISGDHNEDGARVLNEYLKSLDCKKHVIIGMMDNKEHEKYINHFKDIDSITTVDIKNQPNAISGLKLKEKFKNMPNVNYKESIEDAIKSISLNQGDLLLITGSLYLCSEVLNLN